MSVQNKALRRLFFLWLLREQSSEIKQQLTGDNFEKKGFGKEFGSLF